MAQALVVRLPWVGGDVGLQVQSQLVQTQVALGGVPQVL